MIAAIIVTILLVPQSLAYALLAGLPPQVGIYVSIFPLLAYAAFGSSRYLNVGPTAVISLMTAACIALLPEGERLVSAAALAVMTGIILLIAGILKAGFVMNFVSRPVVSAYITGAALLIIVSQIKHIFGITASGNTVFALLGDVRANLPNTNKVALWIGLSAIAIFWLIKKYLAYGLVKLHVKSRRAKLIGRMAPILIVVIFIGISSYFSFADKFDVRVVGRIPAGLPPFDFPILSMPDLKGLLVPAIVISIVAFVDSTSTAQELAARSRGRIDSNKELLGLGASNIVAGITGGYPINGCLLYTSPSPRDRG